MASYRGIVDRRIQWRTVMGNDERLDEAAANRAAKKRRERALADQRQQADERMDTPDAQAAARAFWEAFKVAVHSIVLQRNHHRADNQIVEVEGPQQDSWLVLFDRDRPETSCLMFAGQWRAEQELIVSYKGGVGGSETRLVYPIALDDSGVEVGASRTPESLAAAVMEEWIGGWKAD